VPTEKPVLHRKAEDKSSGKTSVPARQMSQVVVRPIMLRRAMKSGDIRFIFAGARTRDCTKPEKVNSDQNSYGSGRLFKCQYSHIVACSIVARLIVARLIVTWNDFDVPTNKDLRANLHNFDRSHFRRAPG
jgi:hypothetical protein